MPQARGLGSDLCALRGWQWGVPLPHVANRLPSPGCAPVARAGSAAHTRWVLLRGRGGLAWAPCLRALLGPTLCIAWVAETRGTSRH